MYPNHNITGPGSWSVYDQLDRPIPRSQGLYPDPDAPYPPEYYTVIVPSQNEVTIPTQNKLVTGNIIIKPIHSNYGKITWDGAVLTVS